MRLRNIGGYNCGELGMWRTSSVVAWDVEEYEWLMIGMLELSWSLVSWETMSESATYVGDP